MHAKGKAIGAATENVDLVVIKITYGTMLDQRHTRSYRRFKIEDLVSIQINYRQYYVRWCYRNATD